MNLGEKLKKARKYNKVSQLEVYRDTGINNKTLSGYERGISEPDLKTLNLLHNYYKVPITYFLEETDGLDSSQEYCPTFKDNELNSDCYDKLLENINVFFMNSNISNYKKECFFKNVCNLFWKSREL